MKLLLALLTTVALLGVAPSPAPSTSPSEAPSGPITATVHIKNYAYTPATVTIKAGESVRFINDDETAHTVTAADHSFDSGYLAKNDGWTHTFAAAGTIPYLCAYHTYMRGTVTVTP